MSEPTTPRPWSWRDPRWRIIAAGVVLLALVAAWRWGPLHGIADRIPDLLERVRELPAAGAWAVLVYVVAGLVMMPLSILVIATSATFGAVEGSLVAMIGSVVSGAVQFGVGRLLGRRAFELATGDRLARVVARVARRGILAVAVIRNIPVAPYGVVNLAIGASPLRFADFVIGNALGLLPGITLLAVAGDGLVDVLRDPSPENIAVTLAVVAIVAVVAVTASRILRSTWSTPEAEEPADPP